MLPSNDLAPDIEAQDLHAVEQGHRELGLRLITGSTHSGESFPQALICSPNRLFGSSLCRRAAGGLISAPVSRRLQIRARAFAVDMTI